MEKYDYAMIRQIVYHRGTRWVWKNFHDSYNLFNGRLDPLTIFSFLWWFCLSFFGFLLFWFLSIPSRAPVMVFSCMRYSLVKHSCIQLKINLFPYSSNNRSNDQQRSSRSSQLTTPVVAKKFADANHSLQSSSAVVCLLLLLFSFDTLLSLAKASHNLKVQHHCHSSSWARIIECIKKKPLTDLFDLGAVINNPLHDACLY